MIPSRWSVMFLVSIAGLCSTLKITTQTCFRDNGIETKCVPQGGIMWLGVVVENGDPAFIDAQLVNKALANSSTIFVNEALETSIACEIAFVPPDSGYVIQITDTVTDNFVAESKLFEIALAGSQLPEVSVLDPREGPTPTDRSSFPSNDSFVSLPVGSSSAQYRLSRRHSKPTTVVSVLTMYISGMKNNTASTPISTIQVSSSTTSDTPLQSTTASLTNRKYRRWRTKKSSTNEFYSSITMTGGTTLMAPNMSRPHSILSDLREELDQTMSLLATEWTVEESLHNRDEICALQQRVDTLQQRILETEQQLQVQNTARWGSNFDEPPPEYTLPILEQSHR